MEKKDFCLDVKKKLWSMLQRMGFIEVGEPVSTEEILNQKIMYIIHPTIIYVIEAKTNRAKKLLKPFFDEEQCKKIDENCFKKMNWKKENIKAYEETSKYNTEIILDFLKFVSIIDESIIISIKTDYPLKIKTKEFILILAPRVDN